MGEFFEESFLNDFEAINKTVGGVFVFVFDDVIRNIPDMSIYEASEFWDEHEFSEFDDVQEAHDLQFALKKKE